MSDFLDLMEEEGWNEEPDNHDYSSNGTDNSSESTGIDFENTSGLPKKMLSMTIGELVRRHGGSSGLKDWSMILQRIMTADKIDQEMRERRNELIEKDFVVSNVLKYLDIFMDAVFDSAEAQTETIIAMVQSDIDEAKKTIPELRKTNYTKLSKAAKKSIRDSLTRLKRKYDDADD